MPDKGKMLELITWLTFYTDLSESEVTETALRMIAEKQYVLDGNFAGWDGKTGMGH